MKKNAHSGTTALGEELGGRLAVPVSGPVLKLGTPSEKPDENELIRAVGLKYNEVYPIFLNGGMMANSGKTICNFKGALSEHQQLWFFLFWPNIAKQLACSICAIEYGFKNPTPYRALFSPRKLAYS